MPELAAIIQPHPCRTHVCQHILPGSSCTHVSVLTPVHIAQSVQHVRRCLTQAQKHCNDYLSVSTCRHHFKQAVLKADCDIPRAQELAVGS